MVPWNGGWNRGEPCRDFVGEAMRGDVQNANPRCIRGVLRKEQKPFFLVKRSSRVVINDDRLAGAVV
jgi:hypothetical protein